MTINDIKIDWDEIEFQLSNGALARMEPVRAYVRNQQKGGTMYVKAGETFVDWYIAQASNPSAVDIADYFENAARQLGC
jgi:hypothetical protein